jgi:hypothetical protein
MSVDHTIRTLSSEVRKGIQVLERIASRLEGISSDKAGDLEALAVTQLLSNYYTCAETIFLRISRFFENNLPPEKWHQVLLERMTLHIDDVRPCVITDEVYDDLRELMKFRHFSRYYFDLDYDWDRLEFLIQKFQDSRVPLQQQLKAFDEYLQRLVEP